MHQEEDRDREIVVGGCVCCFRCCCCCVVCCCSWCRAIAGLCLSFVVRQIMQVVDAGAMLPCPSDMWDNSEVTAAGP